MNNDNMKGLLGFAVAAVYVLGALGSIGYAFYSHAWAIGVCAIAVAAMVLPYVLKKLREGGILGE